MMRLEVDHCILVGAAMNRFARSLIWITAFAMFSSSATVSGGQASSRHFATTGLTADQQAPSLDAISESEPALDRAEMRRGRTCGGTRKGGASRRLLDREDQRNRRIQSPKQPSRPPS
jgi:hypothetical protein